MNARSDRLWRYAVLAWAALIAVPTIHAAVRWQMGLERDVDMTGVHELVLLFLMVLAVPMAALAFGVFAPVAFGIDRVLKGRSSRLVNVLLGAMISVPAFIVIVIVAGWPGNAALSIAGLQRALGLIAALPLAGMIMGLGLRHRGSPEHDSALHHL